MARCTQLCVSCGSNIQKVRYIFSGQAAINAEVESSSADMKSQLIEAIKKMEQLISEAGYECSGIVRLIIYTATLG